MDDAQLVLAARRGDSAAFAAIYDRYADRIHDFSASTVRDRDDAVAVSREAFLVAFEHLDLLAEPDRLRPWLFAIAHQAALRRIAARGAGADEAGDHWSATAWSEETVSRAELAELVWTASAQLNDEDRTLLDLHLRQDLAGRDLADAAGVPPARLPLVLARLRVQVERSLGALLVARTARRTCPQLTEILDSSPGGLTRELWARVTTHVDDCEVCNSRRRIVVSPLDLLAAAPVVPAPTSLRADLLGLRGPGGAGVGRQPRGAGLGRGGGPASAGASAGWLFTRDGFPYRRPAGDAGLDVPTGPNPTDPGVTTAVPAATAFPAARHHSPAVTPTVVTPVTTSYSPSATTVYGASSPPPVPPSAEGRDAFGRRDRKGLLIAGLAGLILLIGTVTALVAVGNRGSSKPVSVNAGATAATTATTIATTTTPSTTATSTTSLVPTTVAAGPGHLVVGVAGIDFGVTGASQSLVVGNNGGSSLTFTATPSSPQLTVTPATGTIDVGMSETLTVTLDRSTTPTGKFSGTIVIADAGNSASVAVSAVADPGPIVASEMASPAGPIFKTPCLLGSTTSPTGSVVGATVTSPVALKTVLLHWQGPTGIVGSATMTSSGSSYSAPLGPFAAAGTAQWWITAVDTSGVTAMSNHHSLIIASC